MTAAKARLAAGTQLRMANDLAGTISKVLIAEITSMSGPTMSSDLIDVTSQDSTGGFREKIIGLTDPGEISFDIFFNQTLPSHSALVGPPAGLLFAFVNKSIKFFQLKFPPDDPLVPGTPMGTWAFKGVVNGFEIDASVDDALKASITIALSGLPDFSISGASIWA